jgi:hypothetical protein
MNMEKEIELQIENGSDLNDVFSVQADCHFH